MRRRPVTFPCLALCGLLLAMPATAQDAWRCVAADGAIAYQDHPCAAGQAQRAIDFEPAPAPAASPEYLLPPEPATGGFPRRPSARAAQRMSYECRAANGEVFYRHDRCPSSIPVARRAVDVGSRRATAGSARVSATPLTRREACKRMHAAGAGARAGRERDQDVSTYERNLGRDPCR